jgi:GTP-binding protein
MVNFLVENELPFIVVLTKADKLKKMARIERMEAFKTEIPYYDQIDVIPFSSETGEGVEEVRKIIEEISLDID